MGSILNRLKAELGDAPLAIPAIAAIPPTGGACRIAESQQSQGGKPLGAELGRRICAMAERWQYSDDDLAEAMAAAQRDPGAWLECVAADEAMAAKLAAAGMPFLPGGKEP